MKKLLLIAILFTPFFGISQNVVQNSGLEIEGTSPQLFANWTHSVPATGPLLVARETEPANLISGLASVRFTNTSNVFLTSDDITVVAGRTYRLSFRGRIQTGAGPSPGVAAPVGSRLLLTFQFWNGSGWSPFNTTNRPTVTSSTNETTATTDYIIAAGRERTRLVFDKNTGVAYADDVILEDLGVLPITLTNFTGEAKDYGVRLNWVTAQESNNQYFEVLRAGEDKNFTSIGKVNGAVNSSEIKTYSFSDFNPLAGNNYYQLKQVDLDGKSESFGPVVVKFGLSEDSFSVLSASEISVTISISSSEEKQAELSYIGLDGRTLYKQNISLASGLNTFSIPVDKSTGNIGIITLRANGEQKSLKIAR
jgi:hypothetical protein